MRTGNKKERYMSIYHGTQSNLGRRRAHRHRVQLLLVPTLVHQSAKHALLVLEQLARFAELDLRRIEHVSYARDPQLCRENSRCVQRRGPSEKRLANQD